ncbi:MAG: hypothetical protein ACOYBY_07300 [Dermatophilaceae bacterium]
MSDMNRTAPHRRGRRLSLATSAAFHSPTISLFEAVDALASQLLALGWIVRMPRTSWDCEVGVLAVSAQAFSPTTFVQLDTQRRISLVSETGEHESVADVADLVRRLRACQRVSAGTPREAVPA